MKALTNLKSFMQANSPALLSGAAVVGVVSTGALALKAGYTIGYEDGNGNEYGQGGDWVKGRKERTKYYLQRHWQTLAPPVVSGAATITFIVLSNRVETRRTAAAAAAYSVAEGALADYRDKVIEKFGEKADGEIKADIQQDKVNENQPRPEAIVITNAGSQLCQEAYTGRYFLTDMESLRRAQNDLNAQLIQQDCVTLSEWYHMIGLSSTQYDHDIGWNADKLMELEFSAVITEDGRPCMVFEYNYVRPLFGSDL